MENPNTSERISRSIETIRVNIESGFQLLHRKSQVPKNQTIIIENDLRKLLRTISDDYKYLFTLFKTLEKSNNPPEQANNSNTSLTKKELERRRNQLNELGNLIKDLEQKVVIGSDKNEVFPPEKVPELIENHEDRKKSNKQLYEVQKEELKIQENHIDTLLDSVTTIKNIGMNINNELDEEKGLLSELEGHVDKNTKKLMDNNKRLEALLEKVSNQCLICTIISEIIVIILIFILF